MAASERVRLFFALWPEAALQAQCADWARDHLSRRAGRMLAAANLHITLAFVGDVDAEGRACVMAAGEAVRGSPFTLTLDRVGYWRRPQVVWLGARQCPAPLLDLVAQLRAGLAACGIEADSRPFQAHMTVMRKVKKGVGAVVLPSVPWPVADFALVRSELHPEGACYEILRRWPLHMQAML